jgi:hypothetical protein
LLKVWVVVTPCVPLSEFKLSTRENVLGVWTEKAVVPQTVEWRTQNARTVLENFMIVIVEKMIWEQGRENCEH